MSNENSKIRHGYDPVVEHLKATGLPLTRENWLAFAFAGDPPENWEQEIDIPPEIQD